MSAWWLLLLVPAVGAFVAVISAALLKLIDWLMLEAFKNIWR